VPTVVPSQIVAYIDLRMPNARDQQQGKGGAFELAMDHAAIVRGVIELVDRVPPQLIEVDSADFSLLIEAMGQLRNAAEVWSRNDRHHKIGALPARDRLHPLTAIRQIMEKCPDEAALPETVQLKFVSDAGLREVLRRDISAVNQALMNAEWKAATVLAGSVVEALLLDAINTLEGKDPQAINKAITAAMGSKSLTQQPHADRNRWDLAELVPVAEAANLITKNTARQCDLARGFRNLIHPGRSQRLGQVCDRGAALSAAAAVEHVLRDLDVP